MTRQDTWHRLPLTIEDRTTRRSSPTAFLAGALLVAALWIAANLLAQGGPRTPRTRVHDTELAPPPTYAGEVHLAPLR